MIPLSAAADDDTSALEPVGGGAGAQERRTSGGNSGVTAGRQRAFDSAGFAVFSREAHSQPQ